MRVILCSEEGLCCVVSVVILCLMYHDIMGNEYNTLIIIGPDNISEPRVFLSSYNLSILNHP